MRRAKEDDDDRLFLRQWRRILVLEARKTGQTRRVHALPRPKERPAVGSLARYCRAGLHRRSIVNYRKSDQSMVTKGRSGTRLITATRSSPPPAQLFIYFYTSLPRRKKLRRITNSLSPLLGPAAAIPFYHLVIRDEVFEREKK